MKNLLKYKFILFLSIILFFGCCPDECTDASDPDCSNYDPCMTVDYPVAEFGVGYKSPKKRIFSDSRFNFFGVDTILKFDSDSVGDFPTFYVLSEDVDSVFWTVGSDRRVFRKKSFELRFRNVTPGSPIDVQLVVLKKSDCFEGGFVTDTARRTIVVNLPYDESQADYHYFRSFYTGTNTEYPGEEYRISVKVDGDANSDPYADRLDNIPKGYKGYSFDYRSYCDELFFWGQDDYTIWYGAMKIDEEDRRKITIRYKISYDLGETSAWHTFEGIRDE